MTIFPIISVSIRVKNLWRVSFGWSSYFQFFLEFFQVIDQFRRDYLIAVRENEERKQLEEKKQRQEMAKIAAEKARKVPLTPGC